MSKAKLLIIVLSFGFPAGIAIAQIRCTLEAGTYSVHVNYLGTNPVDAVQPHRWHNPVKLLVTPEQNNGFVQQSFFKILYGSRGSCVALNQLIALRILTADGGVHLIHSGTHEELIEAFRLGPSQPAEQSGIELAQRRPMEIAANSYRKAKNT